MIRVGVPGQTVNTLPVFTEGKGHNKDSQMSPRLINILRWHANIIRDKPAPSNCKDNFHLSSSNTCLWLLDCRSAGRTPPTFIQPRIIRTHRAFTSQQNLGAWTRFLAPSAFFPRLTPENSPGMTEQDRRVARRRGPTVGALPDEFSTGRGNRSKQGCRCLASIMQGACASFRHQR